jgi:hypothetical protein
MNNANTKILFESKIVKSKYCDLHHIVLSDAELIYNLRTKRKENYLKITTGNIEDQVTYIKNYLEKFKQKKEIYYKLFDHKTKKFSGALRLTELEKEKNFSWESFVVSEDCTPIATLDGMLIIYRLGFEFLNRDICGPWAVDKEYKRVINLHKIIGMAKLVDADEKYFYYSILKKDYEKKIEYFLKLNIGIFKI